MESTTGTLGEMLDRKPSPLLHSQWFRFEGDPYGANKLFTLQHYSGISHILDQHGKAYYCLDRSLVITLVDVEIRAKQPRPEPQLVPLYSLIHNGSIFRLPNTEENKKRFPVLAGAVCILHRFRQSDSSTCYHAQVNRGNESTSVSLSEHTLVEHLDQGELCRLLDSR